MAHSTDIVGYTYDADTHCPDCTRERFGPGAGHTITLNRDYGYTETLSDDSTIQLDQNRVRDGSTDSEGNPVNPIFLDAAMDHANTEGQPEYCAECGEPLVEVDDEVYFRKLEQDGAEEERGGDVTIASGWTAFKLDDDDRKAVGYDSTVYGVIMETTESGFHHVVRYKDAEEYESDKQEWRDQDVKLAGPQEDDITTHDFVRFYRVWKGFLYTEVPEGVEDWKAHLRGVMEQDKFWPNVWSVDDHGGTELLDLSEKEDS
jgi:hypothetical protein